MRMKQRMDRISRLAGMEAEPLIVLLNSFAAKERDDAAGTAAKAYVSGQAGLIHREVGEGEQAFIERVSEMAGRT